MSDIPEEEIEVAEKTPDVMEIEEPEDTYEEDQLAAYIAERKAAHAAEEESEGEEESDCPDGDCDEESDDPDLESKMEELAARAAAVGMDDDDIAKMSTIEALERTVMILEAQQKSADEEPKQAEEFDMDSVPDDLRPVLEQMTKAYQSRIEALEGQLGQYNEYVSNQAEKAVQQEFDGFVAELGPKYESLFGTGTTSSLTGDSSALGNRTKVLEEMNIMAKGYEASNREVPDEKVLFNRAINSLFGDELRNLDTAARESQIAKRRGAFVGRPSSRHGKQASPEAAAIASVRQYMEEAGIGLGAQE